MNKEKPREAIDVMAAIVSILEDKQPHSVAEVVSRVKLSAEEIIHLFRFLAEYALITYDEQSKEGVICDDFSSLT